MILALCGSLRAVSSNRAALEACALLAPITIFNGIDKLPHFNPDLDRDPLPEKVAELRRLIGACDRLLISSPEYAHGMVGSLKNALDWLVSSVEFPETKVTLINTSPRASHALAQLREVLTTMSAELAETVTLPLLGRSLSAAEIAADPELSAILRAALPGSGELQP